MAVTSGFYNSVNGDRKYDSEQMSELFDCLIADGVFETVYKQFRTSPNSGMTIQVDSGLAWFNSHWVRNDSISLYTLDDPEVLFDRIDAIVIEVNNSDPVRNGYIKVVKGTPSANPVKPTLKNGENSTWQHPIDYITVRQGSESISAADIQNMVGTSSCPFVTGIVSVMDIDMLIEQWGAQWKTWYRSHTKEFEEAWRIWYQTNTSQFTYDFNEWFSNLQDMLDDNVAANLATEILILKKKIRTLVLDHIYTEPIEDSVAGSILDSDGREIEGIIPFMCGCCEQKEVS